MRLLGPAPALLLPLALMALAACGDDAAPEPAETPTATTSACMTHQLPTASLKPAREGLPELDGDIGRSWEPDEGRTDEDAHGSACATLDFEAVAGWAFVRAELKLTDGSRTTTVARTADPEFGLEADMWAYECVAIDALVVLERGGQKARWTGHTEVSPRCEG